MTDAPDILVLGADWTARALLCAQLIEDGYNVVPADAWPVPRRYFRRTAKPRAMVVDLQGLAEPERVLVEIRALASPDRIVVVTALGTVPPDVLRSQGFHVITRPTTIGAIAKAADRLLTS